MNRMQFADINTNLKKYIHSIYMMCVYYKIKKAWTRKKFYLKKIIEIIYKEKTFESYLGSCL